ncbi:hypothetical protein MHU86_11401 [Fragilaria crotonensis]|nr:hypothetical protein MHU86_11401 [Fragilaria crotonensis]
MKTFAPEGIDTRLATYRHAIVDNPLENILGLHEPGRYRQAEPEQPFAYEKIEDLWQEDIDNRPQTDSDHSDDGNEDDDSDNDDEDNNQTDRETDGDNHHNDSNNNEVDQPDQQQQPQPQADNTTPANHTTEEQTPTTTITTPVVPAMRAQNVRTTTNKRKRHHNDEITQRTSTRTANKPERYRNDDTKQVHAQSHTRKKAHTLYKQIRRSRDKLFFIKYMIDTTNTSVKRLRDQPERYKVYEQTIDLCENGLVGPFDFAVPKYYQNEANRIAFEEWEDLKTAAEQHNLDVSDIEEVIPLR